ncbi:MAG TPA: TerB family tellurite resistance protein, partial [Rhodoferax sp.]
PIDRGKADTLLHSLRPFGQRTAAPPKRHDFPHKPHAITDKVKLFICRLVTPKPSAQQTQAYPAMLNPLKNLLTQFFMPEDNASQPSDAHRLQLATAVLLVDVMRSDAQVSAVERSVTLQTLRSRFALSDDELARLVAQAEATAQRANDYFTFTSAMNDHFTQPQKIQVVEYMWQVAYADGHIDANENHLISKIAGLLHVTHGDYIAAKMRAKEGAQLGQLG